MEDLRRRGQVAHQHVVLGAELEEALDAPAGVLRPLALEAVREQQREAREPVPLVFARREELVDDDLRPVGEVAELGLPDHETIGVVEGVAVVEAEHAGLGQRGVEDVEARRALGDAREGRVALPRRGVGPHGVAVREGATPRVLPGEANGNALFEERREGEGLGGAPIEGLRHALAALAQHRQKLRRRLEPLGHRGDLLDEPAEPRGVDLRLDLRRLRVGSAAEARPEPRHAARRRLVLRLLGLRELGLEELLAVRRQGVDLLPRHLAEGQQMVDVGRAHRRLAVDGRVHPRLRVAGLVGLVVAPLAVAVHVDDDVAAEGLTVVDGEPRDVRDGLGVLAVHVEDRDAEHLREVRGVARGARVLGVGREADLVVHHDVQRAARRVALEALQVQRLGDDALADERRVAVDEQRHHAPALGVVAPVLLGAHAAGDDGIHELEVRRVERQREVDGPVRRLAVRRIPEVVFHVAAAHAPLGVRVEEVREDVLRRLLEDVAEHVEPAAVGHAEHDLLDAVLRRAVDHEVEERHQGLAAFEREALRTDEVRVQELLEDLGVDEAAEHAELQLGAQVEAVRRGLHALAEPRAHVELLDVHELHADGAAVGLVEPRDDLPHRRFGPEAAQVAARDAAVQVGVGDAEAVRGEVARGQRQQAERIERRPEVAAEPVGLDQLVDPLREVGVLRRRHVAVGVAVGGRFVPAALGGAGVEDPAPALTDEGRVLLVPEEELLDERLVEAKVLVHAMICDGGGVARGAMARRRGAAP